MIANNVALTYGNYDSESIVSNFDDNSKLGPDEIDQLEDLVSLSRHHTMST